MYNYRKLTAEQQHEVVEYRKQQRRPYHSPPHWDFEGERQFIISGTCYEHAPIIGQSHIRLTDY
jgi:putative transposase